MPNPILQTAIQVSCLCGISNVLAQLIGAYQKNLPYEIDWTLVIQFMLFFAITTPHNYLWQEFLETTFPAYPQTRKTPGGSKTTNGKNGNDSQGEAAPSLSIRNTMVKLVLDQTVGAVVNTFLFSSYTHAMRLALASKSARQTNLFKALGHWTSPGALNFHHVSFGRVLDLTSADMWPMLVAGWKFWPIVSAVNFSMVKTVETRNLVGACAGLVWGVVMSLMTA